MTKSLNWYQAKKNNSIIYLLLFLLRVVHRYRNREEEMNEEGKHECKKQKSQTG